MKLLKSLALAVLLPVVVLAFPKPTGYVTDDANIMFSTSRKLLENRLQDFERKTTIEIAVVTVKSLDGVSIEEYANKLFHEWGIGKKGQNNGVLLLIAPLERKMRIEVGYGLEGKLNDAAAGDIIREWIRPAFKLGRYTEGIENGVAAIQERVR